MEQQIVLNLKILLVIVGYLVGTIVGLVGLVVAAVKLKSTADQNTKSIEGIMRRLVDESGVLRYLTPDTCQKNRDEINKSVYIVVESLKDNFRRLEKEVKTSTDSISLELKDINRTKIEDAKEMAEHKTILNLILDNILKD